VPVTGGSAAEFRAIGRIPLKLGWKAAYGAMMPDENKETDAEQTLPALTNGEAATLSDPKVEAKSTQPPPRYSEGTLVEAMQNARRFVQAPELRERLKEAKGIGTPATRAEIIKGPKRQSLLTADGKFVVPTFGGLQIFELLRQAAPGLVDPATTASWEMRLDDIVAGRGDFRSVIDGIAESAGRLIEILKGQSSSAVDLGVAKTATGLAKRRSAGKVRAVKQTAGIASGKQPARRRRSSRQIGSTASDPPSADKDAFSSGGGAPTAKMVSYAKRLAGNKNVPLPLRLEQDFAICRRFLDQYSRKQSTRG
jgi:DNA topoisomerase III